MTGEKTHKYTTKIKYKHLDMYSVLYHPRYFELLDDARNQFFEDIGVPIEKQFQDQIGFTVAAIENADFLRPIFMAENITVTTEVINISKKSMKVKHGILINNEPVFSADYSLVLVSIQGIDRLPLSLENSSKLRTVEIDNQTKEKLNRYLKQL